ncbi:hypothetical protein [Staphylococcus caeli]|uniref:Uncharacterized protein n=1 Tax=Staphylococcus caeli TaxID=2201815 RepID=A0A1D4PP21_9STAP|nr:hypothetical protein [Staphylococcus caeli]SCT02713.1 Uncharacterised protein [Staphylococcus caeli]SCT24721.1 Uncharacterised protein [Staphylococcus caeli]
MNKLLYIHSSINLLLMIILFTLNLTNTGRTVTLAILFILDTSLLLRANKKQVEKDGATINDCKKK